MGRPGRDQPAAVERMEVAFWDLLEEMPYKSLTIGALARRAGLNHNSVYYHFSSLDDLAREMIERNLIPGLPGRILAGFDDHPQELLNNPDPDIQRRVARACLLVGPHGTTW